MPGPHDPAEDTIQAQSLVAPRRFERVDVPTPTGADLADGEVVVRVLAGGICGSDLPRWRGVTAHRHPADRGALAAEIPGFPLHEIAGEVVHSAYEGLQAGQRVVGWALGFDGLAEYVVTPGRALAPYDPALAPETAVLLQPLACVLHAVERLTGVSGATVSVLGLGPIGLLFAHVLKARGARHVVGVDRVDRSDVAAQFGVDEVVTSSSDRWAAALTPDRQPRVVVEAVGHQVTTLTDAIEAAAAGGCIYYFGIPDDAVYPFPLLRFLRKDLTLISGTTRDYARGIREAGEYLRAHPGLADGYVTHVVPVAEAERAYDLAERPTAGQLKVVVRLSPGDWSRATR